MTEYKLEKEVLDMLDGVRVAVPKGKDEMRLLLYKRKLDELLQKRDRLKEVEYTAIKHLKKVDYDNIKPKLIFVKPNQKKLWFFYRHVFSSAPFTGRPGRSCFLMCIDENSGGVMGVIDIGSDLMVIGPRDKYIGWSRERKFSGGLNHIGNVGTCVCARPFG